MEGNIQRLEEKVEMLEKKMKDHVEERISELEDRLEESEKTIQSKIHEVQGEVSTVAVRDVPYLMVCAYQDSWNKALSTIQYDYILSEYSNGGNGTMDLSAGTFTVWTAGHYTVTISGYVVADPGEGAVIFIYRNEEQITESRWLSKISDNYGEHQQYYGDQGSRTVILHLEMGDSIKVNTELFDANGVFNFIMCVSLTVVDY